MVTVTDGTTVRDVYDMEITESTNELDECEILTDGIYSDNIAITVLDGATTLFTGYQKDVEQNDKYNVTYQITAREKAVEMQYVILNSGSSTTFTKTDTVNNLVAWAVAAVNTAYGYTGGDAWTVDSGSSSTETFTIGCYYTNALAFLRKVVVDNLGKKIWFESATKKVYFGDYYTDRTASPIDYIDKQEIRDSNKRGCTKVIVIGQDSSITGTAGTGNLTRVFEYLSATTTTECENLATALLADLQNSKVQYNVTLDEGVACNVADYINLDGTNYVVTKKVTTFDRVVITTGGLTTSLLDTLGTSITEISGETVTGSDASWSGGNTNVAANAASNTEFVFDVADVNMISNAVLDVTIGSFIKSASVNATTEYLSDVSQVSSASGSDSSNFLSAGSHYFPDSTGVDLTNAGANYLSGFQFGLVQFHASFGVTGNMSSTTLELQYKLTGSSTWYSAGYYDLYLSSSSELQDFNLMGLFSGSTMQETSSLKPYVRVLISVPSVDANKIRPYRWKVFGQRVTRHAHSVTTVYDKSTTGTPPSSVNVTINSTSIGAVTPGTTLPDITSHLISGKNIIKIKTPSGSNNQCSVNPTITYQTLGRS